MKKKFILVTILIINTCQYNYSGNNELSSFIVIRDVLLFVGFLAAVGGGTAWTGLKFCYFNDLYLAPHSGFYIIPLEERLRHAIEDRDEKYKRSPEYQKKLDDEVTFYEQKIKERNEKKEAQEKNKRELSEKVNPENKNSKGSFFFQTTINNRLIHQYWQLSHGQNYNGIALREIIQPHYTWQTNPLKQTAYVMLNGKTLSVNYIKQAQKYSKLINTENNKQQKQRHNFQHNYGAAFTDMW